MPLRTARDVLLLPDILLAVSASTSFPIMLRSAIGRQAAEVSYDGLFGLWRNLVG